MRFIRFILLVVVLAVCCFGNDFCSGWEDGYNAGYCYNSGYACIKRIPPLCPIPKIGKDSYQDGFARGFLVGLADSK